MRFGPLAIALLVTAFSPIVQAQDTGLASDEQILIKQVNTDKKAVYAANLGLTEEESARFWPIYDQYEAKVKPLQDRLVANINNFAEKYDTLSDADATAILKEKMAIEKERDALKQEYTKKIEKVLPGKKAARYLQIESKIRALIRFELAGEIPLVQ